MSELTGRSAASRGLYEWRLWAVLTTLQNPFPAPPVLAPAAHGFVFGWLITQDHGLAGQVCGSSADMRQLLHKSLKHLMVKSAPALAVLLVGPLVVLALLGAWYVEARYVADISAQRATQQRDAREQAKAVSHAVDAAATLQIEDADAAYEADGGIGLRNYYLSNSAVDMVALYDADTNLLFPESRELRLFGEREFLRRHALRLQAAQSAARLSEINWVGSLKDTDGQILACRTIANVRTLCVSLFAGDIRKIAQVALDNGTFMDLSAPAPEKVAHIRGLAPLPDPFNGLAVVVDTDISISKGWGPVLALLAPTLLASAVAALALVLSHRFRVRAAEQRADILAEISHDLRTPLANIRLYADLLQAQRGDSEKVEKHAAIIEEEAARLGWIVDNALVISAGGDGTGVSEIATVPDKLIRSLIQRYGPILHCANDIELDIEATQAATFDVRTFEQVLLNLLDNARKHAPGARVLVRCWIDKGGLHLRVSDTGLKMQPGHDGLHGFGLGLRACQTLSQRTGGTFTYKLAPTGSWFQLTLPCRVGETAPPVMQTKVVA